MQSKDNMGAHDSDMRMPTNKPRNVKQVYNAVHNKKKQRGIANDEIFALYELALQLEGFLWNISIYPEVLITVGLPDLLAHARQMMRESQLNPNLPQLMSYDTTFNFGDFYLSAFVVRNIFLNDDPIYPVAFLLHSRKYRAHHHQFLSALLNNLDINDFSSIPIVTDREKGITEAFAELEIDATLVCCHNHILSDVREWIRKHGGKKDDIKVLKDHIDILTNAQTPTQFEGILQKLVPLWSIPFQEYFKKNLRTDIEEHSSRIVTDKFAVFRKYATATNNISESFNKVLKEINEFKELPVDAMVLSLFHLQKYYLYDFARAKCNLGNYSIKKEFANMMQMVKDVRFPDFIPIDEIVKQMKETANPQRSVEKTDTFRLSQKSLARRCVDTGAIGLAPQTTSFTVRSITSSSTHAVKLFPSPPKCTCPSTGLCYHILAISVNVSDCD